MTTHEIHHIDGDKTNNEISNLRVVQTSPQAAGPMCKTVKVEVELALDPVPGAWHDPMDFMKWVVHNMRYVRHAQLMDEIHQTGSDDEIDILLETQTVLETKMEDQISTYIMEVSGAFIDCDKSHTAAEVLMYVHAEELFAKFYEDISLGKTLVANHAMIELAQENVILRRWIRMNWPDAVKEAEGLRSMNNDQLRDMVDRLS